MLMLSMKKQWASSNGRGNSILRQLDNVLPLFRVSISQIDMRLLITQRTTNSLWLFIVFPFSSRAYQISKVEQFYNIKTQVDGKLFRIAFTFSTFRLSLILPTSLFFSSRQSLTKNRQLSAKRRYRLSEFAKKKGFIRFSKFVHVVRRRHCQNAKKDFS